MGRAITKLLANNEFHLTAFFFCFFCVLSYFVRSLCISGPTRVLDLILPLAMSSIVDLATKTGSETVKIEVEVPKMVPQIGGGFGIPHSFEKEQAFELSTNYRDMQLQTSTTTKLFEMDAPLAEEIRTKANSALDATRPKFSFPSSTSAFAINKRSLTHAREEAVGGENATIKIDYEKGVAGGSVEENVGVGAFSENQPLLPKMPLTNGRVDETTGNLPGMMKKKQIQTQQIKTQQIQTSAEIFPNQSKNDQNLLTNGNDTLEQRNLDSQNSDYMPVITCVSQGKKLKMVFKKTGKASFVTLISTLNFATNLRFERDDHWLVDASQSVALAIIIQSSVPGSPMTNLLNRSGCLESIK